MTCIFDLDKAERANALSPYLKSLPSREDLTAAMQDKFMPEAIEKLWAEIQAKGWDKTAADWEIARRQANAEWRAITGETFGEQKAVAWRPVGLDPMMTDTVDQLQEQIATAKATVENSVAALAIDDAEKRRLQELAGDYNNRAAALTKAKGLLESALREKSAAIQARSALPVTTIASHALVCPHCQGKTVLRDLPGHTPALEKYEEIDESVLKARRLAIAEADGLIANKSDAASQIERQVTLSTQALAESRGANDRLSAPAPVAGQPISAEVIVAARDALAAAEKNLVLRQKMDSAAAAFLKWRSADARLALLVPDGLRSKTLGQVIDVFNSGVLAPLCEVASWPTIALTQELTVTVGGRPRTLVSTGMQWRAQIILQAAMASLDGSTMLVIDNLPDLDANARNGLFCILQHIKLPALICMANISEVAALDMAKHNLGGTWHIKDGKTVPFGMLAEAAE